MLPPSIPRRPKKQSQAGSTNDLDLESINRFETEPNNEQMASIESLKSEDPSDKIPVIPKRPERSKPSSRSPSLPVIPKRPQRSDTSGVEALSSLDSSEVENETETNKSINEASINSGMHSNDAIDPSKSSELNSEVKDISELDDSEGDKTPSNTKTKTTIKEDLKVTDDNSIHSFDDDLKTVLQERDDNELPDLAHDISNVHSSGETDRASSLTEDVNLDLNREESCESENKEIDEFTTESNEKKSNEVENQSNSNEESEKKVGKDQEVSQMSKLIDEKTSDDKYSGNIPHIPRRPKKSKAPTNESNFELFEVNASENPNSIDQKQKLIEISSDEAKSASSINEDSQKSETLHPEKINSKPKAPPKPKKLSSKIAAFQQMFNQENAFPKNSESNKQHSKQDLEEKSPDNKDVPSRLSTDKMKFAQSLQGMMGKGIAMPGMVNPNFQQKMDTEEALSSNKEVKIQSVKKGITRGPRGKKLPKSLKNPVNVEVPSRFSSFVLTIWELDFQSSNEGAKEDIVVDNSTETKNLENTQEILKSRDSSEGIMDSDPLSSSICPTKSEEEVPPLRIGHDGVYQEIQKPGRNEHERKNLEDVCNVEDSEGSSEEKISEEVEHDEAVSFSVKLKDLDLDNDKQHILENKDSDLIESEEHKLS